MHQKLFSRLNVLDDFIINLGWRNQREGVSVGGPGCFESPLCAPSPQAADAACRGAWPAGHMTYLLIAAKRFPSETLQNMLKRTSVPL